MLHRLRGGFMRQVLTIAGLTALAAFVAVWTWLCVKGTVLAARQGRKAGWIQAAWTVWGAAIGLVVAAVTLAIGAFIVLVVAVSLSRLGEHSGDCDAWTDQCAEPLDDFGDYPLGP
jgi:hypothetical protein